MNGGLIDNIGKVIQRQVDNISKRIVRAVKVLAKPFVLINQFVRTQVKSILRKPASKKDYVHIMGVYLSKRLFALIIVGFFGAATIFSLYVYPFLEGRLWVPKIVIASGKLAAYNGPAHVINDVGTIIYSGDVVNGQLTGKGEQYDPAGLLVYKGGFKDGKYTDQGELYVDGVLRYSGQFSDNLYDGEGRLYDETGALIYQGAFSQGEQTGVATAYRPDTHTKSYYGTFSGGVREGSGVAYEEDGETVCYRGAFSGDLYEGAGKYYEKGILRYSGQFSRGLFEGEGVLYDESGKEVYKGAFSRGVRQGAGVVYDALGSVLYNGLFSSDSVNYTAYLGAEIPDLIAAFGAPGFEETAGESRILTYPAMGLSFLCELEEETWVCGRIITDITSGFLTVKAETQDKELEKLFGEMFSKLELPLTADRQLAFRGLSISVGEKVQTKKYLTDLYYVKVYYNRDGTALTAVECGRY